MSKRKIICNDDQTSINALELKDYNSGLIIAEDSITGKIKGYVSRDFEGTFIYTDKNGTDYYDDLESLILSIIAEDEQLDNTEFYFID